MVAVLFYLSFSQVRHRCQWMLIGKRRWNGKSISSASKTRGAAHWIIQTMQSFWLFIQTATFVRLWKVIANLVGRIIMEVRKPLAICHNWWLNFSWAVCKFMQSSPALSFLEQKFVQLV